MTVSGTLEPIRWIGRRSYAGRYLAARRELYPVLIRAGALGDGLPHHDLRVSSQHAMLLGGVLVPARLLVTGTGIVMDTGCSRVDYFHVELDRHNVLFAEGAPSESFVDDDSRGMFHNAAEWKSLYPGRHRMPAAYCAPRLEQGAQLEAIRQRLAAATGEARRAA